MVCDGAIEAIVQIHIGRGYRYPLLSFPLKHFFTVSFNVIIWVYKQKP